MEGNLYVEARREWDERYADLVLGKRNWQIAAGGLLVVTLILAAGSSGSRLGAATSFTSSKSTSSDTR